MHNYFKGEGTKIMAPISGISVNITEIDGFKDRALGDGVAIIPNSGQVASPCSGKIVQISHNKNTICVKSDDDVEVLIHLGTDTAKLGGEGFTILVELGEHVNAGQHIATFDIDFIPTKGCTTYSPCIITNMSDIKFINCKTGEVVAGVDAIIEYEK